MKERRIGGVKIESERRDIIYYMIHLPVAAHDCWVDHVGASIPEGASYEGFGDPAAYGYTLGGSLYTNITEANRVPDTGARWWALNEIRISTPGVEVSDLLAIIRSCVFTLWTQRGPYQDRENLLIAPMLSLPSDEGLSLLSLGTQRAVKTAAPEILNTRLINAALHVGCLIRAGRAFEIKRPVDLYVVAHVVYFYAERDKRTENKRPPEAMSGPSGVRFSTAVVEQINALVKSGLVSSKSAFIREAVDAALLSQGGGSENEKTAGS